MKAFALGVLAMIGCGPEARENVDAGASDASTAVPIEWQPITVTGTTPVGGLDAYQFAYARYAGHWCAYAYEVVLAQAPVHEALTAEHVLRLSFAAPDEQTSVQAGVYPLEAHVIRWPDILAHATGTFDASIVDPPRASAPRVVGTAKIAAPGWSLEIPIDLVSQYRYSCF